jgi:hypothetical protein
MFPNFHKSGTIPDCKDALYILVSGFAKIAAVSFNAFGCILSGPGDLFGLYLSVSVSVLYWKLTQSLSKSYPGVLLQL